MYFCVVYWYVMYSWVMFLSVCNGLQGFTRTIRPIPLLARAQGPWVLARSAEKPHYGAQPTLVAERCKTGPTGLGHSPEVSLRSLASGGPRFLWAHLASGVPRFLRGHLASGGPTCRTNGPGTLATVMGHDGPTDERTMVETASTPTSTSKKKSPNKRTSRGRRDQHLRLFIFYPFCCVFYPFCFGILKMKQGYGLYSSKFLVQVVAAARFKLVQSSCGLLSLKTTH